MTWWEEWWRRRRPFERIFEDINKMMEDMFKEFTELYPKELIKERKLPDGSIVKTFGPYVYGYSFSIGPDGKPVLREFGNLRPTRMGIPKPTEEREPLVDVIPGDKIIQVIAEVPGVEKEDINLNATEDKLIISVDTPKRKYYKEVDLPEKVDPKTAVASYKNGVLEVVLNKVEKKRPIGEKIEIE